MKRDERAVNVDRSNDLIAELERHSVESPALLNSGDRLRDYGDGGYVMRLPVLAITNVFVLVSSWTNSVGSNSAFNFMNRGMASNEI